MHREKLIIVDTKTICAAAGSGKMRLENGTCYLAVVRWRISTFTATSTLEQTSYSMGIAIHDHKVHSRSSISFSLVVFSFCNFVFDCHMINIRRE